MTVEAIEGQGLFQQDIFWSAACSEVNPCVLHHLCRTVRPAVEELMASDDLALGLAVLAE